MRRCGQTGMKGDSAMVAPLRLGYVALDTDDLEASTLFWTNVWGLEVSERTADTVYLRGDQNHHWIALRKAERKSLARWAMEVETREELDILERRLLDAGIKVESGDGLESDHVARYVRFADPSGTPLEL